MSRAPETQKIQTPKKLALSMTNIELQNLGFIAFYDIQPGNRVGLFLQPWSQVQGLSTNGAVRKDCRESDRPCRVQLKMLPVKLETSVIKYLLGEHSGDLYC